MFKVIKEEGTVLNQLKPHIDSPYSPTKDIHFFKKELQYKFFKLGSTPIERTRIQP